MTHSPQRVSALVAGLVLLGAASGARAAQIQIGASVPLVLPFTYTPSVGVGVTPSVTLNLGRFALSLTSGALYYSENDDHTETEIPVLLGGAFMFADAGERTVPYLVAKLGYTYAVNSDESSHWITAMAGGGALVALGDSFRLDVGVDCLLPDLRGNSDDPVGLLLKVGFHYAL